jgi:hypothetical protein
MMSRRDKRALTIAAIAGGIFLLLEFGALPIWDAWQAERGALPVREQTFVKFRDAVASRAVREAENVTLATRLREVEAGLLNSDTPALASAELREWVQQLAREHSLEVLASQFLPVKPLGADYWQVPLNVQVKGRLDSLVSFLKACGAGSKTLSVTRMSIQRLGDPDKSLNVSLTLAGVLRRAANEPREGAGPSGTP